MKESHKTKAHTVEKSLTKMDDAATIFATQLTWLDYGYDYEKLVYKCIMAIDSIQFERHRERERESMEIWNSILQLILYIEPYTDHHIDVDENNQVLTKRCRCILVKWYGWSENTWASV